MISKAGIVEFRKALATTARRRTEKLDAVSSPTNCPYCDHPALGHDVSCHWDHSEIACVLCNCSFADHEPQFDEIDELRWSKQECSLENDGKHERKLFEGVDEK